MEQLERAMHYLSIIDVLVALFLYDLIASIPRYITLLTFKARRRHLRNIGGAL